MDTPYKAALILSFSLLAASAHAQGAGGSTGVKEPNEATATQPSKSKQMSRDQVKSDAMEHDMAASGTSGKHMKPSKSKVTPQPPEKDLAKP